MVARLCFFYVDVTCNDRFGCCLPVEFSCRGAGVIQPFYFCKTCPTLTPISFPKKIAGVVRSNGVKLEECREGGKKCVTSRGEHHSLVEQWRVLSVKQMRTVYNASNGSCFVHEPAEHTEWVKDIRR